MMNMSAHSFKKFSFEKFISTFFEIFILKKSVNLFNFFEKNSSALLEIFFYLENL